MSPVIPGSAKLIEMTNNLNGDRLNNQDVPKTTMTIEIPNNNNEIVLQEDILHIEKLPEHVQELCNASLKVNYKTQFSTYQ